MTPGFPSRLAQVIAVGGLGLLSLWPVGAEGPAYRGPHVVAAPSLLELALAPAILAVGGLSLVQVTGAIAGRGRRAVPSGLVRFVRPLGFAVGLLGALAVEAALRQVGEDPLWRAGTVALSSLVLYATAGLLSRERRQVLLPLALAAAVGWLARCAFVASMDVWRANESIIATLAGDVRYALMRLQVLCAGLNLALPCAVTLLTLRLHRLDERRLARVGVTPFVPADLALLPLVVLAVLGGAWVAGPVGANPDALPLALRSAALETPYVGTPLAVLCAGLIHRAAKGGSRPPTPPE